jgi:hypothetical protein
MFITCLENENEDVANWARHKKHEVIASGLNKFCSLMNLDTYEDIRNNTNAAEQTANKSYSMGKKQNLLPAIQQ